MFMRAFSGCVVAGLMAGVAIPSASAEAHPRQTNIDLRNKRVADMAKVRRTFVKQGNRPYFVQVRRDGKVSHRKLWRNTKKRLGNAKATPDTPAFLQRLEEWRTKRAAGGAR